MTRDRAMTGDGLLQRSSRLWKSRAMFSRKYTRYLYVVGTLFVFFVVAFAIPHDQVRNPAPGPMERRAPESQPEQAQPQPGPAPRRGRAARQIWLSPQERFWEEYESYPRIFPTLKSTMKRLIGTSSNPKLIDDSRLPKGSGPSRKVYRPFPAYDSEEWKQNHRGTFQSCVGPRGKLLVDSLDDQVTAYEGLPEGFPPTLFGSYEAIGLDGRISFDRYGRYGAYGFGENEENVEGWVKPKRVNWDLVNWGSLQRDCHDRNAGRFLMEAKATNPMKLPEARSVVLLRSWVGREYTENDMITIRSIIMELALHTGGEFEIVLLTQVKDESINLQAEGMREQLLAEYIPPEFWDITEFWNQPMVRERYGRLNPEKTDVHRSQWLPVQYFMLNHPHFEYVWNWEVDSRWTGHLYEFVDKTAEWGRRQPRRGMWERNERFYIPSHHGDYDNGFRQFVDQQTTIGIWGPMALPPLDEGHKPPVPRGPSPPVPLPTQDNYEWGVGEEADVLGFLPYFNPQNTDWVIRLQVYGYLKGDTPRRAGLIIHNRLSRRLIMAMDHENLEGRHMGSEMFAPSTALIHGLKALTVPHPVFADRLLPGNRVSRWWNSGINGRTGNTPDSPFSWGRESRFTDVSWYYHCNLPGRLYWNFIGWEKDGTGGPDYEKVHGRHVLPSILFHPIKDVTPEADSTGYYFEADTGLEANPEDDA